MMRRLMDAARDKKLESHEVLLVTSRLSSGLILHIAKTVADVYGILPRVAGNALAMRELHMISSPLSHIVTWCYCLRS